MPTIVIAVFEEGSYYTRPSIKFINYNAKTSEKIEMVPASEDEIKVSRDSVVEMFEREISKKKNELLDLQNQLDYFMEKFLKVSNNDNR